MLPNGEIDHAIIATWVVLSNNLRIVLSNVRLIALPKLLDESCIKCCGRPCREMVRYIVLANEGTDSASKLLDHAVKR